MTTTDIAQLKMLAEIDELVARVERWTAQSVPWDASRAARSLLNRVLKRVDDLRIRLEAPLIVATFGGTGTGKSSLVNALVGREVSRAGRQRPTTTRPLLLIHPQCAPDSLGLDLGEFEVHIVESPVLRDIAIVDCPDPDTTESETPGSNLAFLHRVLPSCDVLIYTTTQQKYRSAVVGEELAQAASGCRLLFVQSHADVDEDIRRDWADQLRERYEVPEMFFVDSLRGLREQQSGQRPSGDLARLQDLLTSQVVSSQRTHIRRANLLDQLLEALQLCVERIDADWSEVEQLRRALAEQKQKVCGSMARLLQDELQVSSNLWERRLLSRVNEVWGFSPFSSILRFYNGLGGIIASFSFFRARTPVQMAVIGAMEGVRRLRTHRESSQAKDRLERVASLGMDDEELREAQIVIRGFARGARIEDDAERSRFSMDNLRQTAALVQESFLSEAGRKIDDLIDQQARRHTGTFTKLWYEFLFLAYTGFILFLIGKNFFYDALFSGKPLYTIDFYLPAGLFFLIWSGTLVMLFTRRVRRGLGKRIETLAREMAESRFEGGLFPGLEDLVRQIEGDRETVRALRDSAHLLREDLARPISASLGSKSIPVGR